MTTAQMKINPTATQIAKYTSTVTKIGKKWFHQLFDENGEVIATRNTVNDQPYSAACVSVTTRNARLGFYKREMSKSRCKYLFKEDIKKIEDEIASGLDANEYRGCEITWTRGNGSSGYGSIVARLVPCKL